MGWEVSRMGRFEDTGAPLGNASVQYELKRAGRIGLRDTIICLVIIVVVLLFRIGRGGQTVSLFWSEDNTQLTVTGVDGTEHMLVFSELESVELHHGLADFDRGEQCSGEMTKTVTSGRFRNDAYGEYELHVMNDLDHYIVARGSDGVLVFNYEADGTTDGVYEFIRESLS